MNNKQVYLLHDGRMTLHRPLRLYENEDDVTYENPDRIIRIYDRLADLERRLYKDEKPTVGWNCGGFIKVGFKCDSSAYRQSILQVHSKEHYDALYRTQFMSDEELLALTESSEDLYFNSYTFQAAVVACGGVIQCVEEVTSPFSKTTRAIAVVRPPGHHAMKHEASGFCFFNNVAVAAKHSLRKCLAKRVFILDWDIHHGNGIQDLTYDDPNIFYVSIHRGPNRKGKNWFYPGTGFSKEVGEGLGAGTNLTILWDKGGMTDVEYSAAFTELVLPVLKSYDPDLIMIACGLDAAKGDLLGDCGLSPEAYYNMTQSLLEVAGANTPIVAVLEGGYNVEVSAVCMEQVALALLDQPSDLSTASMTTKSTTGVNKSHASSTPKQGDMGQKLHQSVQGASSLWWNPDSNKSSHIKKSNTNRAALSSIRRSTKALSKAGVNLQDNHEAFEKINKKSLLLDDEGKWSFQDSSMSGLGSQSVHNDRNMSQIVFDDILGHDSHNNMKNDSAIDAHRPLKKRRALIY